MIKRIIVISLVVSCLSDGAYFELKLLQTEDIGALDRAVPFEKYPAFNPPLKNQFQKRIVQRSRDLQISGAQKIEANPPTNLSRENLSLRRLAADKENAGQLSSGEARGRAKTIY